MTIDPALLQWMQEIAPQVESLTIHFAGRDSVAVLDGNTFRAVVRDVSERERLGGTPEIEGRTRMGDRDFNPEGESSTLSALAHRHVTHDNES